MKRQMLMPRQPVGANKLPQVLWHSRQKRSLWFSRLHHPIADGSLRPSDLHWEQQFDPHSKSPGALGETPSWPCLWFVGVLSQAAADTPARRSERDRALQCDTACSKE